MSDVALALVSHTNVGKTTLARTLLRRDVGSVFDQAHVTETSESWVVTEHGGHRLVLWDTPGFGDTARLLRRLEQQGDPLGWFLHQVWDRLADRALWCGQQALKTLRDEADLVLYLVNATEDPEEAGYVEPELSVLEWVGKPVVVLLNQTGAAGAGEDLLKRWREAVGGHALVREVLPLDAFTRCWVQEVELLDRLAGVLEDARGGSADADADGASGAASSSGAGAGKAAVMRELATAWHARHAQVFEDSVAALGECFLETLTDRESLPGVTAGGAAKRAAMDALAERQEARETALTDRLLSLHELDGEAAARLREETRDVLIQGTAPLDRTKSAIWGGLVTGAATGVGADFLAGGLTFGGGAVLGAVVGALGGAGLARGFEVVLARGKPQVSWSEEFLHAALRRLLLRYLAVAQFGRGRGVVGEAAVAETAAELAPWRATLEEALSTRADDTRRLLKDARKAGDGGARGNLVDASRGQFDAVLRAAIAKRFPNVSGSRGAGTG